MSNTAHTAPAPAHSSQLQSPSFQAMRDDLTRKLAKLTDENWAKDLEIQNLRSLHAAEEAVAMRLKAETSLHLSKLHEATERVAELERMVRDRDEELTRSEEDGKRALREMRETHAREKDQVQESNAQLRQHLSRVGAERAELERQMEEFVKRREAELHETVRIDGERIGRIKTLENEIFERSRALEQANANVQSLRQALDSARAQEGQMNAELGQLRTEKVGVEKIVKELNETIESLRSAMEDLKTRHAAEMGALEDEAQHALNDVQSNMQAEFQEKFEVAFEENKKLRQMLEVRDNQTEIDRSNLKQWQEQLHFLDQHLRMSKDALKKDRAEILRLAKQLTNEFCHAKNHPFQKYVQLTDGEISRLQTQFANTSQLSPMRLKIEERLTELGSYRDYLLGALADAERQLEERVMAVNTIVKGANLQI